MRVDRTKRVLTFLTFFVCTAILSLLTAALATQKWIVSRPIRHRRGFLRNSTDGEGLAADGRPPPAGDHVDEQEAGEDGKFRGDINFGLFQGTKVLNYGFGDRIFPIWIKDELMKNSNLMPFGLWLFTILSVATAILFGIVSSIFAIINTVITPIEVITGLQGLFLWNGMGALFCTSACISWLLQYRNRLRRNVLTQDELDDGWDSKNRSKLGYSFFLVVFALGLYLLNIFLVYLAIRQPWRKKKPRVAPDKNPEGVIMLY